MRKHHACPLKDKSVDHLSLIVIVANNRCWKPRFLYVTLAMVTLHLDRYMLMMGVMAYSPTHTDGDGPHTWMILCLCDPYSGHMYDVLMEPLLLMMVPCLMMMPM